MPLAQSTPSFLKHLWEIVNNSETDHIISWDEEGTTFVIHNKTVFIRDILPAYYKHRNMSSFVRQLNLYDFHKVESAPFKDKVKFYHPLFVKDHREQLKRIKRKNGYSKPVAIVDNGNQFPKTVKKHDLTINELKGEVENLKKQIDIMNQDHLAFCHEVAKNTEQISRLKTIIYYLLLFVIKHTVPPPTENTDNITATEENVSENEEPTQNISEDLDFNAINDIEDWLPSPSVTAKSPPIEVAKNAETVPDDVAVDTPPPLQNIQQENQAVAKIVNIKACINSNIRDEKTDNNLVHIISDIFFMLPSNKNNKNELTENRAAIQQNILLDLENSTNQNNGNHQCIDFYTDNFVNAIENSPNEGPPQRPMEQQQLEIAGNNTNTISDQNFNLNDYLTFLNK